MKRVLQFAVPAFIGVAVLIGFALSQRPPEQLAIGERVQTVRVIPAPSVAMVPRIRAYGSVAPARIWQATAEVGGRVIYVHPRLDPGEILPADTVILRIDPTDYELALSQIAADIEATEAQLTENEVRDSNTRVSLAIELESLKLSEEELDRRQRLATQGAASQTAVDEQSRTVLAQRQSVASQENTLRLLPAERRSLEAQLTRLRLQLRNAERDIERTAFKLPFNARIAAVNVDENESVRVGDVLVEADDIRVAEIQAEVPLQRMRNTLITSDLNIEDIDDFQMRELLKNVKTRVRLADFDIEWEARAVRLSPQIDPKTRTLGLIVEVEDHYRQAVPGVRPPLVKDMFVEVEFWGVARPNQVVIPRTVLHEGRVHVMGSDGRLQLRPVTVGLVQPEFVSVAAGLNAGELVVVSDLVPAIEGMLLEGVEDDGTLERLVAIAEGGQP